MEFLGVGPLELFFILVIALIFLGPRDMVKAGRTMGKFLRQIVMSPTWRMVQQTSRELRTLPNRMIREAGMEEDVKDLNQIRKDMENQIGSMRKPFSAAADETNESIQATQRSLNSPGGPATAGGLSAWITPPDAGEAQTGQEPAESQSLAGNEPVAGNNPAARNNPATTETSNTNES
jgi:Sec-independent protein translocase protein TatA